jgi:di/tricarboxylate transporter
MSDLAVVLALLAAAIAMFAINKPRLDAVALIMLTALPFTGVLTMGEALAGFSDPNIVLIAALFVLGDGLVRTGVARQLGDWLIVKAGRSEIRLIVLLMVAVCGLGATMSSTAVTAIFIPVVLRISKSTGVGPGRLMMPLSFAALISGMMTLVATAPNLVVNGELERHGVEGFSFFSFTPFGLPVLVLGIIYMCFAHRWLPDTSEVKNSDDTKSRRLDRTIQARGPRIPSSRDRPVIARRQDPRRPEPASIVRRKHCCRRTQPQIFQGDPAPDREDGATGR